MSEFTVAVPATVANLGPGFDSFGMAVDLTNEVAVRAGPAEVEVRGEGASELPLDGSNLIRRTMAYLAREVGRTLPDVSLICENRIPLQRGLGSSSAAIVAGVLIADRLLGTDLGPDRLLQTAADLEGHADNVAPALRGGIAIAFLSKDGWRAEALRPHPGLRPVLLIPLDERLPTDDARRVLPTQVPRADATFNLARAALLSLALTERPELLIHALEDRLHQAARLPLVPAARAVFESLRDRGIPVCVAGAGPSLLAFETPEGIVPEVGTTWRVLRVSPAADGARIR